MNASASPAAPPSLVRRLGRPLAALVAVGVPTLYVAGVDPNQPGHYPTCPFLQATGWWCPGCGGLRAVHALAHGRITEAAHDNVLVLGLAVFAVLGWLLWCWAALTGTAGPRPRLSGRQAAMAVLVLLAFTVFRNLPAGHGFAPPAA
ncbi:DUF2752 domain-containing protein [Kitasatospora sp. MMS16-BH015]|uniref:DUF2752 domain-containing protein n=1 Tax=Kitasatospora sp. MMS16-BH015 TaxID=2018025 RepID=UPI0020C3433A|nr:DUF2752 domain-containing protein [Kitasatospora sp. MMS16-BH015]